MSIPERDWRALRVISRTALDRYCARVLDECAAILAGSGSPHARYLSIVRVIDRRDRELAGAFDDLRRSTAVRRLAAMIRLEVVTHEELAELTAQTRESATAIAELR